LPLRNRQSVQPSADYDRYVALVSTLRLRERHAIASRQGNATKQQMTQTEETKLSALNRFDNLKFQTTQIHLFTGPSIVAPMLLA
jgi:hypothetical protein